MAKSLLWKNYQWTFILWEESPILLSSSSQLEDCFFFSTVLYVLRYWALPDSDLYLYRWITDKAKAVRKLVASPSNGVFAHCTWWRIRDLSVNPGSERARSGSELLGDMNYIELVADESGGYTGHIKCAEAFFQLGLKRWIWSLEKINISNFLPDFN